MDEWVVYVQHRMFMKMSGTHVHSFDGNGKCTLLSLCMKMKVECVPTT